MGEYQKLSLRKTQNNRQHFLKGRMDSPPPYCCSSGTASSSLSQPISLEFGPPPISLQNLSSSKENWPKEERNNEGKFNSFIKTSKPPNRFIKYGGNPIKFDDLIYGSLNNFCWENNENKQKKTSLMIFSSSEDLTTSDSEICKYSSINRGGRTNEEINRDRMVNFGKFPSLSTIYPNNSSLSLDDSEQQKEMLTTRRHYNNEGGGLLTLSDSETEMTNYLIKNKKEFNGHHNLINKLKKQKTPQRIPALEMVEEISPVLPRPNLIDEDFDVPPLPRPLQSIGREWRPLKTSTLANLHSFLPRTNPRQQKKNGGIVNNNLVPQVIPLDPPRSLFDPFFPQQSSSSSTTISARPEQFNLPSALAKSFGIKGILFIQIAIVGNSLLIVHVRNGALFLENSPSSCYVKVEIRRSPSNRKRSKYDHRFRSKLSSEVRESNWPEFFDDFQFKISPINLQYGDKLGLSLYITTTPTTNISSTSSSLPSAAIAPAAELLGRMSFSLRKFFRLAKQQQNDLINGRHQPIQICEGGFFLLPDRLGQQSHLSQKNILHKKYYDEIGVTGCSSISSNSSFGSPFKMMSEPEWAPSLVPNLGRTNFLKNTNFGKNQKIAATNNLNNCSNSSSSQSGVDCKRRQMMADSSDFTSLTSSIDGGGVRNVEEDSFNGSGGNIEDLNKNNNCSSSSTSSSRLPPKPSQKQIYSSTSSSTTELPLNKKELNNNKQPLPQQFIKRNSVTNSAPLTDKLQRKNQLGPLGRTFNFLKSKLDFSLSASVLCPSKEECRLWQEDFFTLLSHKYGCMLFREFLQSEFSEENLDFWLDVENFKQMKDSKKQTLQKAQQIYDTYIKELAPKEVNLDSETRMKTKNGLQSIPLKTDIFNLAQNKIEQLMSKDSYSRFLKSEQYLDLLDDIPNVGDKPRSASNGLLRVSSTKSNGSILNNKRSTASRSPSLSPKLGFGGGGRCVRRNTCSPTSPVTSLQIPCIRE
uniref:RGS domain-containing protein n=1 Tax=Meloidogyne enterolobii TaxID=390850 RepID=A0A6V7VFT8_MELEN|nr:unnamed protein product [Meloidogyne enterolobii]